MSIIWVGIAAWCRHRGDDLPSNAPRALLLSISADIGLLHLIMSPPWV